MWKVGGVGTPIHNYVNVLHLYRPQDSVGGLVEGFRQCWEHLFRLAIVTVRNDDSAQHFLDLTSAVGRKGSKFVKFD